MKYLLLQAIVHMLKAQAWPHSRDVPHWQAEARGFRSDTADILTPSMRQRIDDQEPLPVPAQCPVALDELLSDEG